MVAGLKSEIHVLAQQLRCEGSLEIQIDERWRFVAREDRAHHTIVHEIQERMAWQAGLLRQDRDLGQRLGDHTQKYVVTDLRDAGELAITDVTDSSGTDDSKKLLALLEYGLGPRA